MEFLPLEMHQNGILKPVYAGFGKRFLAAIIDFILLMVCAFFIVKLQTISLPLAILSFAISSFLFAFYNTIFNARYGGTLGKLIVGVRVTHPDGTQIGWKEAFMRSIVDVFISIIMFGLQVYAISKVNPNEYLAAGIGGRSMMLISLYPFWYKYFNPASQIWYWSEMVVLLFNKRKRAIHDYIAGTVVIHKDLATY